MRRLVVPSLALSLAGYGRDIAKSRAEARRLLREAGVPDGTSSTRSSGTGSSRTTRRCAAGRSRRRTS
jgi:hypothetical protein